MSDDDPGPFGIKFISEGEIASRITHNDSGSYGRVSKTTIVHLDPCQPGDWDYNITTCHAGWCTLAPVAWLPMACPGCKRTQHFRTCEHHTQILAPSDDVICYDCRVPVVFGEPVQL